LLLSSRESGKVTDKTSSLLVLLLSSESDKAKQSREEKNTEKERQGGLQKGSETRLLSSRGIVDALLSFSFLSSSLRRKCLSLFLVSLLPMLTRPVAKL
jgi:hypothetical protein